jgi:hypothetical protein
MQGTNVLLHRYFSLKHEFSNDWNRYINGATNFELKLSDEVFPFYCKGKAINITDGYIQILLKNGSTGIFVITGFGIPVVSLTPTSLGSSFTQAIQITANSSIIKTFTITKTASTANPLDSDILDIFLVLNYHL